VRQTGKQVLTDTVKSAPKATHKKPLKKLDGKSNQTPKIDENDVSQYAIENESKPSSTTPVKKVDENDLTDYVKNAYNPLNDIHAFDEDLYQRILKLELADDGLPSYELDEPFDF
jgi:hypothetical protein